VSGRITAFLLLCALSADAAGSIEAEIEKIEAASPGIRRGYWGALFVRLADGEVLFSRNADSLFMPASNVKLFSTATALARLGPNYRFVTRLTASRALDPEGVLRGDLNLAGGGDPTLSGRVIPYDPEARAGDPLAPLGALVEDAWRTGLRRVTGNIIGDDSRYLWEPVPDGWSYDDTLFDYGAPVSALALHDNTFVLHLRAGAQAGAAARILQVPALPYFVIDSQVGTVARRPVRISLDRSPGSRQIRLGGSLALRRATSIGLAVDDPAHYAAWALRELLTRRGIAVAGDVRAYHRTAAGGAGRRPNEGLVLAHRESAPLIEILRVINKVSQNLHAEMVLREVAAASGREPTHSAAVAEMIRYLGSAGIGRDSYSFRDASGLSRLALVSPAATVRLIRSMAGGAHGQVWRSLLPVGGEDGTLHRRFRVAGAGRVYAKTGTLSHTGSLCGLIEGSGNGMVAFAVYVNNSDASGRQIREFIDKVTGLFVE
jgi:D-alanyl-D-alanine carboxypeptidase/D-alanyl-D-alanine-endopeptidase (penicillin-binding protein 4)